MNNQPQFDELEGERALPSVNAPQKASAKRGVIFLVILVMLGITAFLTVYSMRSKPVAQKKADDMLASHLPQKQFNLPPAPKIDTPPPAPTLATTPPPPPIPVGTSAPPAFAPKEKPKPVFDKSGSSLMISNSQSASTASTTKPQGQGALDNRLTATSTPSQSARLLPNRSLLLAKGSYIDCVLQTRLDTTVPGMSSCIVTQDVFSDNGKVVLIERGSTVSGEYQSNLAQGQNRIFVLWSRIKTPNGVIIDINSPASDSLGGAGIDGHVDNHFFKRFGGAILLTLINAGAQLGSSELSKNGNNINLNGGGSGGQDVATEALRNTINIPPTLYKNQGDRVGIYVARDLDFSGVYDVQ